MSVYNRRAVLCTNSLSFRLPIEERCMKCPSLNIAITLSH